MAMIYSFAYNQANGGDRLWRKNRNSDVPGRCTGVDLNRNWPYQWEAGMYTVYNVFMKLFYILQEI